MRNRLTCTVAAVDGAGSVAGTGTYYCGWAITGRTTVSHLVASAEFPVVGSRHRSWCGRTITVIGFTLDPRCLPRSCARCNQRLRALARTQ